MNSEKTKKENKKRVNQTDIPAYSLEQAIRVPMAIAENYASKPTKPLDVAAAMSLSPKSSQFRMLTGAAIAYGLTIGGYNASEIELTPLAKKITCPPNDEQSLYAKREALLKPRIIKEFLTQYNGNQLPKENIIYNIFIDKGVPSERVADTVALIFKSAENLGLIREIKGKKYVNLDSPQNIVDIFQEAPQLIYSENENVVDAKSEAIDTLEIKNSVTNETNAINANRKVFVTHGKNKEFVEPIKKLLSFGELEAVVSVERQSVSQPVPDKVMNDMRSCGAAIIHVEDEMRLLDKDANEHVILNPNVLIEIGAAMALYGKRFILLVKEGVKLPSNLQGLFEVRYDGEALDGNATIKLLEAINELKKQPKI